MRGKACAKGVKMIHAVITAAQLWALGQLESGGDDGAVGLKGEISRWQVMPKLWQENAPGTCDPRHAAEAIVVVKKIWQARVNQFEKVHQKTPSLEELALLWHSPKHVENPAPRQWDYAVRFKNLAELDGR